MVCKHMTVVTIIVLIYMSQEEWSGYEFEARLLFKVHSALLGLRELGYS